MKTERAMTAWWHLEQITLAELSGCCAKVVTTDGQQIYVTKWHPDVHSAVNEAECWMRCHSITHGAEVGE